MAKINPVNSSITGIYTLLLFFFVIFSLYFAQSILIPLIFAILLTFLLAPLVTKVEKFTGRVVAVILVVILVFSAAGVASYAFTRQMIGFSVHFQEYKENIQKKVQSFRIPMEGTFQRASDAFESFKTDILGISENATDETNENNSSLSSVPFKVINSTSSNILGIIESFFGSFFGIMGTSGLVLVLVMFMLFNREDLRGRIIKLIGGGKISSTTQALDEAGHRVSQYLLRLLVVNFFYGFFVAFGLFLIGIPNPVLWGGLSFLLRFIPYVGAWIAALPPIILSIVVSTGWTLPLLTVSLFVALEIITANLVEPLFYAAGTGVSSVALIIAAVFWTWLWGPIGLVLSTPMTVCLAVMGRHVQNLDFLSVLLSDEKALEPYEECYHSLLLDNTNEAIAIIDLYLKDHSLADLFDHVLIPVLTKAETDYRLGMIDVEKIESIHQGLREIIEDLEVRPEEEKAISETKFRVLCIPARGVSDEFVGLMLAQLLRQKSIEVENIAPRLSIPELMEAIQKFKPNFVCISVAAPSTIIHARYFCVNLIRRLPRLQVVIGMWDGQGIGRDLVEKLYTSGAKDVVFSLEEAVAKFEQLLTEQPS